jgi:hypothetical protein
VTRAAWLAAAVLVAHAACGGDGDGPPDQSCGFADGEPNDEAGGATPYAIGAVHTGCLSSAGDVDHLLVAAPQDGAGGIVRVTIGNVGAGTPRLVVLDAAGGAEIGMFQADAPGAPLTAFFAISGGTDAHIAIADAGNTAAPYSYELGTSYEPVPDAFEPNDAEQAAAPMTAGTSVQGYLFAGAGEAPAAYDDYYRFTAAGGMVTINLDDVPVDLAARVFLFRSDGAELARVSSGQRGGALIMQPPMPLAAGDHLIRVSLWGEPPATAGQGDVMPDHFTRPYRLTVK